MVVNYLASNLYSQQTSSFYSFSALRRWAEKLISDTAQMPRRARGPLWGRKCWHIPKWFISVLLLAVAHHLGGGRQQRSCCLISLNLLPSLTLHSVQVSHSASSYLTLSTSWFPLLLWHAHKWIITLPSGAEMFLNCTDITSTVFHVPTYQAHAPLMGGKGCVRLGV